jgi:hypothetical protein
VTSTCHSEQTSLRVLSARRLPRSGRGIPALSFSSRSGLPHERLAYPPLSPLESALTRAHVTADSKRLARPILFLQPLYNQHFRPPSVSAENKGLITPVESTLTKNAPATPLESALTKKWGVPSACRTANPGCFPPKVTAHGPRITPPPPVLLHHPSQGAKMTSVSRLHRETSPLLPVSNEWRADIGSGIRRLPYPVASRSRQLRERTRKKAWVLRSNVGPISRVARAF